MQENPWHLRVPTTEHYQWFRNLVDLHRLTEAWRLATNTENLTATIGSHLGRKVQENLWMLDTLLDTNIEQFLDDTLPEDMLGRLEHAVWAVQAGILSAIINKSNNKSNASESHTSEAAILSAPALKTLEKTLLEQSAWNLGRTCVEARWRHLVNQGSQDLRSLLLALHDTPFSGYPNSKAFLVRRAVSSEIEVELKSCPHLSQYAEVHSVADSLCNLYTHWMRGFTSALNSKIEVELTQQSGRCLQRWCLKQ